MNDDSNSILSQEHGPLKPFLSHLEDLRWLLIKILSVVGIFWIASFYFGPVILQILELPLKWSGIEDPKRFLRVFGPGEIFSISFQLALYAGLVLASPIVFYLIANYVLPALTKKEKRAIAPALWLGSGFFLAGVAFCYFVVLAPALKISREFTGWLNIGVEFWAVNDYISFVTNFMIGMGVAFEIPLVILALVRMGILDYAKLSAARRYVIVLNFILGAVLTTPEVFTQLLMAVPLTIMYEVCVWIAWFRERRSKNRSYL